MAARQRETRHELDDGFIVAWDSSEPDEDLREKLLKLADEQIGGIVIGMGGADRPQRDAPPSRSPRRRRAAA